MYIVDVVGRVYWRVISHAHIMRRDEPTPTMVRRKARPNRRHADRPVGEVRMVEDEEGEVEVPDELRPTTLSNNVLRFPREED